MNPRQALSWKSLYYGALLPGLTRLGAGPADAVIAGIGRVAGALPPRRFALERALARASVVLNGEWDAAAARKGLAVGILRTLARDYLLEGTSDSELAARFDVEGAEAVEPGRGAIVVGCHLGAHLAGVHWMVRRGLPLRLLVQRPRHVSPTLHAWFDAQSAGPLPQEGFFLRRNLGPGEAVRRVMLARDALRAGRLVYINGDVPWPSPSARVGRFLGVDRPFLTLWADLAASTGAAVFRVFCTHQQGGRYRLRFERAGTVAQGREAEALEAYLSRLERMVAADPGEAVPYLMWPTYTRPGPVHTQLGPHERLKGRHARGSGQPVGRRATPRRDEPR